MIVKVKILFEDGSSVPAMIRVRGGKQFPKAFGKKPEESFIRKAWKLIWGKVRVYRRWPWQKS